MLKSFLIFSFCLAFLPLFSQESSKIVFSHQSGYYVDSIILTMSTSIPNGIIRYTINGSEPDITSPVYSSPLTIKAPSPSQYTYSAIASNPSLTYPLPEYSESRANSRGWLPPYGDVFRANLLKAKVFVNGISEDSCKIATYIIRNQHFDLPIMSISIDSLDFFGFENGIYIYGKDTLNGGNYRNDTAFRKIAFEYIDTNGLSLLKQAANAEIHGNGGRISTQKSLKLVAQREYGNGTFDHPFFENNLFDKYDKLLLRNGGHRPDCFPRDDIALDFYKSMDNLSQNGQQVIVLINGEFWGIQTLKEIMDDNYFFRRFGMPKENLTIVSYGGLLLEGQEGGEEAYQDVLDFVLNNDLTIPKNYDSVKALVDIESFIDFQCTEIFISNGDWPNNNTKIWRDRQGNLPFLDNHLDGKWRWLLYDLDASFGGDCKGISATHGTLEKALDPLLGKATRLFIRLLENESFKHQFINRYCDLLNSNFSEQQLKNSIDKVFSAVNSSMTEHTRRWRYPSVSETLIDRSLEIPDLAVWNDNYAEFLAFAEERAHASREEFMLIFGIQDSFDIHLNVNDTAMGLIKLNSLYLDKYLIRNQTAVYPWTGNYFSKIPIELIAIPKPGYKFKHWNSGLTNSDSLSFELVNDTTLTAVFEIDSTIIPKHLLYLNEIQSKNNSTVHDEYYQYDDWIEIYNPNSFQIDLAGFYISDEKTNLKKFKIGDKSKKTMIPAKSHLLIWMDKDEQQGDLHGNFKLSSETDSIYLTYPDGVTVIDSTNLPVLNSGDAFAREADGSARWLRMAIPTPYEANHLIVPKEEDSSYLHIYPNPSKDLIYFTSEISGELTDIYGKKVFEFIDKKSVNITHLRSGIYFVKTNEGRLGQFLKF